MIKNYFRIAFRNLLRNKAFATINIGGIAIGLTAVWLIGLYVTDEFSYDRFHKNSDRIVRVAQHAKWDGGIINHATTSAPFAASLQSAFPEIEKAARIIPEGGGVIKYHEKALKTDDIFFADNSIFDVFSYEILAGDKTASLLKPQSIILTESLASALFGDPLQAVNQTVFFENNYSNLVTAVIKDIPQNAHMRFSALRSLPPDYTDEWQNFNSYTYLLLKQGVDYKQLEAKMPAWAKKTIQGMMGVDDYRIELQPLTSIHLNSNLQVEIGPNNSMSKIYILIAIAALILIIALINYMNLSTARSSIRIKEVGVRKVLGSGRQQLIGMFVTEALLVTFIAGLLAVVFVSMLLPSYNALAGKQLTMERLGTFNTIIVLTVFAIITGIISGSYPALFLSRFKTIPALRGEMGNLSNSILFRKSLVVFQFIVTVIMISASFVIYRQMKYVSGKDLGFNKEQVLTFHVDDQQVRTQMAAIKSQLLQNPLIEGVAAAGNPIGNNNIGTMGFQFEKNDASFAESTKLAAELMVDADYVPTLDIRIAAGRNFSEAGMADKYTAAMVNETLVKEMGWKNAIGKRIRFNYGNNETGERTVVGVVKDFHTFSLQHKVEPMVLMMPPAASMEDNIYIKINTEKTTEALAFIEKVYKQFDKSNPISFHFLDKNFAQQYAAEQKQEQLSLIFTILAIFIACIGLFGLAAFTAQQKTKEIGIRKVLGASVVSVIAMLSKTYLKLVFIAILIALPISWLMMNSWLQDFAYRVNISLWMFISAGSVAILIALVAVSFQAIKAAVANPVKSLRTE